MSEWQTKSSKVVYENPWMIVHEDQVVMPNGKDGVYGYVESKSDSAIVVPVDDDNNTYIIQLQRYTKSEPTWETIAGRTDGESYEQAGARELLEEAGVHADTITLLREVHMSSGMTKFKSGICIATNLSKVSDQLDQADGIIRAHKLPILEVRDMILRGEITSGSTIAAILLVIAHLEQQGKL